MTAVETRESEERPWVRVLSMGTGPPLVGVPTAQGHHACLLPALGPLADRHRVVVASLRGEHAHGSVPPFGLADLVEDLAEVYRLAGLEHAALFGTSFGGAVALAFTLAHPARVDRLILNVTSARLRDHGRALRAARRIPRGCSAAVFHLWAAMRCVRESLALPIAEAGPAARRLWRFARAHRSPGSTVWRRVEMLSELDLEERLREVRCPVLVLSGERRLDGLVPRRSQEALLRGLPDVRHAVVAGTGHLGLLTAPERVGRLVADFLVAPPAAGERP